MDKDFHYYGTYVAACYAGYSAEEAKTIAHAAQYVDDSTYERIIKKEEYSKYGIDFQLIQTCHDLKELGWNILTPKGWLAPSSSDLRKVWVPFHFLPGNYRSKISDPNASSRIQIYQGPQSWLKFIWKYDDEAIWEFELQCLPDSPISIAMINDINSKHKWQSYKLHLIGLRMHVLADTAAHAYYAGTPAWHVNDVDSDVYYFTDKSEWEKIQFNTTTETIKGFEQCAPEGATFESDFYLGHGRMGHLPDYPWIKYKYTPKWREEVDNDKKEVVKDNPTAYLGIFKKIVTALKCIRDEKTFDINSLEPIDPKYIGVILDILKTKHDFGLLDNGVNIRCEAWKKAISNGSLGPSVTKLEEYNPDAWLNNVKQNQSVVQTDYYKFNKAAVIHFNFVKNYLSMDEKLKIYILFYTVDNGVVVGYIDSNGKLKVTHVGTIRLSNWTKIIAVGSYILFYRNDSQITVGYIDSNGEFKVTDDSIFCSDCYIIPINSYLLFYRKDGCVLITYIDSNGKFHLRESVETIPKDCTYIILIGSHLLFYRNDGTGVVAYIDDNNGKLQVTDNITTFGEGWSQITTVGSNLLFHRNDGCVTVGYIDSNGKFQVTYNSTTFAKGRYWIFLIGSYLLFYRGDRIFVVGYIDSNGKFQETDTIKTLNKVWNQIITVGSNFLFYREKDVEQKQEPSIVVGYIDNNGKLQVTNNITPFTEDWKQIIKVGSSLLFHRTDGYFDVGKFDSDGKLTLISRNIGSSFTKECAKIIPIFPPDINYK